jgi:hypothetical protein
VALLVAGLFLGSDDPARRSRVRTIVLITPDTLGRTHVGAYGARDGPSLTPRMDGLAASGRRFTAARAPVPLTLPAHAAMLGGAPPPVMGVRTNAAQPLPGPEERSHPLLAERLREARWRTGAFVSAGVLASHYGLDQGFETYDDEGLDASGGYSVTERAGEETVRRALAWIRSLPGSDHAFLWVHLFEPHAPYSEDGTYAGGVAHVDRVVGELLDGLREAGRGEAVVLLAADHGESLGALGEASHGMLLGDATLEVPFLLHVPGEMTAVDDRAVRLEDVAPTLAALAAVPWPAPASPFHGTDVLGASPPAGRHVAESFYAHQVHGWAQVVAVHDGDRALIDLGEGRWLELASAPPGEAQVGTAPVGDPAWARRLGDVLAQYKNLEQGPSRPAGDAPGYYSGGGGVTSFLDPTANARLPDPYRMIGVHARLDGVKAVLANRGAPTRALVTAREELERLRRSDPGNPEAAFLRGRALIRLAERADLDPELLAAGTEALLESMRLGRRAVSTVLVAVDAEARQGLKLGGRAEAARRGLALLDRLEADLGQPDCRLLLLRARLLGDLGTREAAEARAAACRAAAALCRRPSDERPYRATCGP